MLHPCEVNFQELESQLLSSAQSWEDHRNENQKQADKWPSKMEDVAYAEGCLEQTWWNISALGWALEQEKKGLGGMHALLTALRRRIRFFGRRMHEYGLEKQSTAEKQRHARAAARGAEWASRRLLTGIEDIVVESLKAAKRRAPKSKARFKGQRKPTWKIDIPKRDKYVREGSEAKDREVSRKIWQLISRKRPIILQKASVVEDKILAGKNSP